jgi:hypothetical protein
LGGVEGQSVYQVQYFKMNISYPPIHITNLPPALEQLGHEAIKALAFLLVPIELLYFSVYFHLKGHYRVYKTLTFLSIAAFWISPYVAPISCGPARCLQNCASTSKTPVVTLSDYADDVQLQLAQ